MINMSCNTQGVLLGSGLPYAARLLDTVFGAGVGVSDVTNLRKASMLVSCLQWASRKWTL